MRATISYHSNDGRDDEETNVDEQAGCIAPNIDTIINYKHQHRHVDRYLKTDEDNQVNEGDLMHIGT